MSRKLLAVLAATAAALAGVSMPASASAATPGSTAAPGVRLLLSVTFSDADPVHSGTRYGYLTCDPVGGKHNNPAAACAELAAAGGDLSATDQDSGVACTLEYAPVTVRAVGWYGDQPVKYKSTYGNHCVFAATAGEVWNI